jgi:uncharacterized protein YndB with AHSA1/START domain
VNQKPQKETSIRKELIVRAPRDRAFRDFTERIGSWWPKTHHIGKAELARAVLEPREGGRWYEIGVDGSECNWGKVLKWEPPKRLVLAWQIRTNWQYDPNLVTEVEVTFVEEGPGRTRFTLEHRDIEKLGPNARELWEGFAKGWAEIAGAFVALAETLKG